MCIASSAVSTGTLSGSDVQQCINDSLFERGEDWLETTVCLYATEGVGAAFCESGLFSVFKTAFNDIVNPIIEKPVIEVLTTVEDAAISFAGSIASALCFWC